MFKHLLTLEIFSKFNDRSAEPQQWVNFPIDFQGGSDDINWGWQGEGMVWGIRWLLCTLKPLQEWVVVKNWLCPQLGKKSSSKNFQQGYAPPITMGKLRIFGCPPPPPCGHCPQICRFFTAAHSFSFFTHSTFRIGISVRLYVDRSCKCPSVIYTCIICPAQA